jgi:hypothetical protein
MGSGQGDLIELSQGDLPFTDITGLLALFTGA